MCFPVPGEPTQTMFSCLLENQERQGSPYLDEMVEKYLRAIHSSLAILVQEIWLIFHPF